VSALAAGLVAPPARVRRLGPWLVVAIFVLGTYLIARGSLYTQSLCLTAAVFAVLALSVNLVATTGLYSLAQAGLFAIGAYTCAILAEKWGTDPYLLLPICVVGCGLVGLVLGMIALRVSGLYFTISTFIFTLIVNAVVSILDITGGYNGIPGPILEEFEGGLEWLGSSVVWVTMAVLLVAIGISWSVKSSALYPVLLAIRDGEPLAAAMGARTSMLKVLLFALSAALAGAAGWCFALLGFISPGQFGWSVAVNILAMVVLGGMGTTLGPIIGAAFISIFPAEVNINALTQEMIFGAIFVIVIVLFPEGAMGVFDKLVARLRRGAGADAKPSAAEAAAARKARGSAPPLPGSVGVALKPPGGAPRSGPAVRCRGLVFRYPNSEIKVVDEVDFDAEWGMVHGLIGPNGSGKSTLVDLISGRRRPEAGTIEIGGERVERAPAPRRARLGMLRTFQSATLVGELSIRRNVLLGQYHRVPRIALRAPAWPLLPGARRDLRDIDARSDDALAFVGAAGWESSTVTDIPHGIAQLTQLASICVGDPRVIILDEPLAGLSPAEVTHTADILRRLKESGMCVILIEHQPSFVFQLCDRVTVLDAGQVVADAAAAEVREDEQVREVYLGR
jgi:branched-chain amino acid transport system permease protein